MVKLSNFQTLFSVLLLILMMSSCDSCKEENEDSPDDNNKKGKCTQNYTTKSLSMNYWYGKQPAAKPPKNMYIDFATGQAFEKENSTCDAYLTGDDSGINLVGMNGTKFKILCKGDKFGNICDQQLSGDPSDQTVDVSESSGTGSAVYVFKDQDGKYGAFWAEHVYAFTINDWWRLSVKVLYLDK